MSADVDGSAEPDTRGDPAAARRRLSHAERREQILAAATVAFVRHGGFSATGLGDVATEAGITRMFLYRHFESKADLFQQALTRAAERLFEATTEDGALVEASFGRLLRWAAAEPAAFQLLFRYAPREARYREDVAELVSGMANAVQAQTAPAERADDPWSTWVARLANTVIIEGVMEWLDMGCPDPERATEQLGRVVDAVLAPFDGQP